MSAVACGLPARMWRRAVMTGGMCAGGLVVVYLLAVWTPTGQRLEDAVLGGASAAGGSVDAERAADTLDGITAPALALAIAAVLVIGLARRRPLLGLLSAGVVVASVATVEVMQHTLLRPILLEHGRRREDQSFPSGHAVVAMSVICALVLVAPYLLRGVVLLVTSVWAATVEVAAVTAGWHRPSDVLGSDLIVLMYTSGAVAVLARYGRIGSADGGRAAGRMAQSLLAVGYGGVALVALAVAVAATVNGSALLAGRALALYGSAGVALALLALLRGVDVSVVSAPTNDRELAW